MLTTTETSSSILGGEAQVIVIITISRYRLSSQLDRYKEHEDGE